MTWDPFAVLGVYPEMYTEIKLTSKYSQASEVNKKSVKMSAHLCCSLSKEKKVVGSVYVTEGSECASPTTSVAVFRSSSVGLEMQAGRRKKGGAEKFQLKSYGLVVGLSGQEV